VDQRSLSSQSLGTYNRTRTSKWQKHEKQPNKKKQIGWFQNIFVHCSLDMICPQYSNWESYYVAIVSFQSSADSSHRGIVNRHMQCTQSHMHLAESAAPSGSSRLTLQWTLEAEINKHLQLLFANITDKITSVTSLSCQAGIVFFVEIRIG